MNIDDPFFKQIMEIARKKEELERQLPQFDSHIQSLVKAAEEADSFERLKKGNALVELERITKEFESIGITSDILNLIRATKL